MRLAWGVLVLIAGACVFALGDTQGQRHPTDTASKAVYELSDDATAEILFLTWAGGMTPAVPEYHLYADDRLERKIVAQGKSDDTPHKDVVTLSAEDVQLLMDLVVESGLAELTPDRLKERLGRSEVLVRDAGTAILRLHFKSFRSPDKALAVSPYTAVVRMAAPSIQAKTTPGIREVKGMVALSQALEAYFPVSAWSLI